MGGAMTNDEIIEMARQADALSAWLVVWDFEWVETFAKLVAAKATDEANARSNTSWTSMCKKMVEAEREACALVCDDLYRAWMLIDEDDLNPPDAFDCKRAIKLRGEA